MTDDELRDGCYGWMLKIALVVLAIFFILGAIMDDDDPKGRCSSEPGPNGMTISTCYPDD